MVTGEARCCGSYGCSHRTLRRKRGAGQPVLGQEGADGDCIPDGENNAG